MRRMLALAAAALGILVAFVFLNNTNLLAHRAPGEPLLLAHRGVAQRFSTEGLTSETCTAARMLPSGHALLENTIPSMQASFEAGADVIELDVHPTTDGKFAVFHDWTLDCRTNGTGVTREHSMAEMKALDIGYGYTADGGKTFPFRGQGVGLMPSLAEVLAAFPGKSLLINIKSRDAQEGERLAAYLQSLAPERRAGIMAYGGGSEPIQSLKARLPELRVMSAKSLKDCLLNYLLTGWTGVVPESCKATFLLVPINIAPWLWGWPDKFLDRMDAVGTSVFVAGPYGGGEFSTGLDAPEDLAKLPPGYSGGIWTDEIETIGAVVRAN